MRDTLFTESKSRQKHLQSWPWVDGQARKVYVATSMIASTAPRTGRVSSNAIAEASERSPRNMATDAFRPIHGCATITGCQRLERVIRLDTFSRVERPN